MNKIIKRKYSCNHTFFDNIDNEEKAYWVGFYIADGSFHKHSLCFELSKQDEGHLSLLKETLDSTHPIKYRTRKSKIFKNYIIKKTNTASISIYSPEIERAFGKLNILKNKNQRLDFPKIDQALMRHFIRGIYDGDGCFCINYKSMDSAVSIVGQKDLCTLISDKIKEHTNLTCSVKETSSKNGTYQVYMGGNKKVNELMLWIYTDSLIYLDRKYDKCIAFNNESNQRMKGFGRKRTTMINPITKRGLNG